VHKELTVVQSGLAVVEGRRKSRVQAIIFWPRGFEELTSQFLPGTL
jgi:hypothetical protein